MYRDVMVVVGLVAVGAVVCIAVLGAGFPPAPYPPPPPPAASTGGDRGADDYDSGGAGSAAFDRPARPPDVQVFADRAGYADWLKRHAAGLDARRPESVDFSNNQVVV